jgi:hypothetical protein
MNDLNTSLATIIDEPETKRLDPACLEFLPGLASRCLVRPLEIEYFHMDDEVPIFTASLMEDPRPGRAPATFDPESATKPGRVREELMVKAFGQDAPEATARIFYWALRDWFSLQPFRRLVIAAGADPAAAILHAPSNDSPLTDC